MKRATGFYWVKWLSEDQPWTIADLTIYKKDKNEHWFPFGGTGPYSYTPNIPKVIGERISEPSN